MTAWRNPFAYPKPITLDTLPDLFAHHTHRFGGWRMEDDGGDGGDGGTGSGNAGKGGDQGAGSVTDTYTPPASQADLERILGQRLSKEWAKYDGLKPEDVKVLREKAVAHDKALEAAKSDADKAVDAARKEGESAATERANARLVGAEARALAAEAKFRNPTLAVRSIDLADVKVNEDGDPDADAIKVKLKELADSEPYLVDDGKNGKPKPDKSQGNSGGEPTPSLDRGRELYKERHGKKTA